jgi:hypothetical protein
VDDVGVGEEEPRAGGALGALPARPALADPAVRQGRALHHRHPRVVLRRRPRRRERLVGGLVVDHDHLEVVPLQRAEAADRRADAALLVPGGDDHADAGAAAEGRLVVRPLRAPALVQGEGRGAGPQGRGDPGRQAGAHPPERILAP